MNTTVSVMITFHGPFHIATGESTRGLDSSVDPDSLLPGSSLKGLMRQAAASVLGDTHRLVREVFGTAGNGSAWSWTPGRISGQPRIDERSRIAIGANGVVEPGALLRQEIVEADTAEFTVICREPVAPDRQRDHLRLLAVAARLVRSLGADRNRGYGWVSLSCSPTGESAEQLAAWLLEQTGVN